jgi:hypothetical protein
MRPAVFSRRNVFRGGPSRTPRSSGAPDDTLFLALDGDSGLANAPDSLTLNGVSVDPIASYRGQGATAGTWSSAGYDDLVAGGGSATTVDLPAPFTATADRSVRFPGARYYQAASAAFADVGTEDIVIEAVFRAGTAAGHIAGKFPAPGYELYQSSATAVSFQIHTGTAFSVIPCGTVVPGAWYHVMVFIDRDEVSTSYGSRAYLNAVTASTGSVSGNAASLSGSSPFVVGARASGAGFAWDGELADVRVWKRAAWLAGGVANQTEGGTVALERFARRCGIWPSRALGASAPTTLTRTSVAHLDIDRDGDGVRRLFAVGAGWPRLCRRKGPVSGYLRGLLPEPQATNLFLQSQAFGTSWTVGAGTARRPWTRSSPT